MNPRRWIVPFAAGYATAFAVFIAAERFNFNMCQVLPFC